MLKKNLGLLLFLPFLVSCSEEDRSNQWNQITESFSDQWDQDVERSKENGGILLDWLTTQPVVADTWVEEDRNREYDSLLPNNVYLTAEDLAPFTKGWYNFPQKLDSITPLLGVPHFEDGNSMYWIIDENAELAVTYNGEIATNLFLCTTNSGCTPF